MRESGARRGRGGRERSAPCGFCRQSPEDLLSAGQWVMRAARRAGGRPAGLGAGTGPRISVQMGGGGFLLVT